MASNMIVYFVLISQTNALIDIRFGTILHGEILTTKFDLSLIECWSNCERRVACQSISYFRKINVCYLFSWSQSLQMTTKAGVISRVKSNKQVNVVCGKDNCKSGEVCDAMSKMCKTEECSPTNQTSGVDIFGNMTAIGSKRIHRCKVGYIPTEGASIPTDDGIHSRVSLCTKSGWQNEQLKCVPLTCKRLNDIGIFLPLMHKSYSESNKEVVRVFCEFDRHRRVGYSFLSVKTFNESIRIEDFYNRKDHIVLRHIRDGIQYESKIQILPHDRNAYNVSIFNSENPDFSGPTTNVKKPYFFVGFIPVSFGSHRGHVKGYTCNGLTYTFRNCDDNRNNYLAIFQANNVARQCYRQGVVKDGWINCATPVASSQILPVEMFFNSIEIGMGGCGCMERNCRESVTGLAVGLPFDY